MANITHGDVATLDLIDKSGSRFFSYNQFGVKYI